MDAGVRIRFGRTDLKMAKTMFLYGLPLMVGNLAAWVLSLSDRYVLGLLRGTSEVGLYSLSYNIADKSIMLLATLFLMAEPAIGVRIWENQGEQDSQRFVANVARLYLLLGIPAAVGLSVVSRLVVSLLGGSRVCGGIQNRAVRALRGPAAGAATAIPLGASLPPEDGRRSRSPW